MSHFFAYLSKMKYVERWNIMRNTQRENILEHSAQCAMIAHALCLIRNERFGGHIDADHVAVLALYHEAPEVITGDLATPIKYFDPEIEKSYKAIERHATRVLIDMLPAEYRGSYDGLLNVDPASDEHAVLKAADKLCAYIKCLEEGRAGNGEFERAQQSIRAALDACPLPEVKYFLDEYIESFKLTLDELN